jgi:hypothetical protein
MAEQCNDDVGVIRPTAYLYTDPLRAANDN